MGGSKVNKAVGGMLMPFGKCMGFPSPSVTYARAAYTMSTRRRFNSIGVRVTQTIHK
jgi:hypothetical protein